MKILVIEDEKNIVSFLKRGLENNGFQVTPAYDGETGLALLKKDTFDIVILDIILPGKNGWEICSVIRNELKQNVPILMLSALNRTEDIVKGLNGGADDYLGKPFQLTELLARLKALYRRRENYPSANEILRYADLEINEELKEVWRAGDRIKLTARELNLLRFFLQNPEKVLTRDQILDAVWGVDFDTGTNVVDVYVNYLRNKIDRKYTTKLIKTVFGIGYILKSEMDPSE